MGRARIHFTAADKQAAYRRRQAGVRVDVGPAVFEASVAWLQQLVVAAHELPEGMPANLRALIAAVSNRDGYRQWQIERQRQER